MTIGGTVIRCSPFFLLSSAFFIFSFYLLPYPAAHTAKYDIPANSADHRASRLDIWY